MHFYELFSLIGKWGCIAVNGALNEDLTDLRAVRVVLEGQVFWEFRNSCGRRVGVIIVHSTQPTVPISYLIIYRL